MVVTSNFSAANLNVADVTDGPVDAFYGARALGLPWTYGTTENLTVLTLEYNGTDDLSNALSTAQVPGFGVTKDCVPAEVGNLSNASITRPRMPQTDGVYHFAEVSGPDCQLLNVSLAQSGHSMSFPSYSNSSSGRKLNYQGSFDYYICNTGFNYEDAGDPSLPQPNATSPEDYRFLLTIAEVIFFPEYSNITMTPDGSEPTIWTVTPSTAVLCKPSYSVDLYTVTLAPSNQILLKAEKVTNTSISLIGFSMQDLLEGIMNSLALSDFGPGGADYVIAAVPSIFLLLEGLLPESNNVSGLEAITKSGLLQDLSTQALQGIGTQFAEQFLKQDQRQSLSGSISTTEERLQVKRLTVGLLLTTLGILTVTVLILVKIRPWDTAPCANESLSSAATILAASDTLRGHFQAGGMDLKISVKSLEDRDYQSVIGPGGSYSIEPVIASRLSGTSSQPRRKKSERNLQP